MATEILYNSLTINSGNSGTYSNSSRTKNVTLNRHIKNIGIDVYVAASATNNTTGVYSLNAAAKSVLFPSATAIPNKLKYNAYCVAPAGTHAYYSIHFGKGSNDHTVDSFDYTAKLTSYHHTFTGDNIAVGIEASSDECYIDANMSDGASVETLTLQFYFTRYSLSASAGTGVTGASVDKSTAYKGDSVTFTASVSAGAEFDGWYDGNTKVSTANPYSFRIGMDASYETLTAKARNTGKTLYVKLRGTYRPVSRVFRKTNGVYVLQSSADEPFYEGIKLRNEGVIVGKGQLITMNLGNGAKQYRVVRVNGNIAECLAMYDAVTNQPWNSASQTTSFEGITCQRYAGSTLDTYLNGTFYGALSAEAKAAIVSTPVTQDVFYRDTGTARGNPVYHGTQGSSSYTVGRYTQNAIPVGNRYVYALSVQDVLDYIGATPDNTALNSANIWQMFYNTTTAPSGNNVWLRTADAGNSAQVLYTGVGDGNLYNRAATDTGANRATRAAFSIDLTKIDWE